MITRRLFYLFLLFSGYTLFAQDEDGGTSKYCNEDLDKKAKEFYEKGIDKKKYKKPERMEFLGKALSIEPDFAEAHVAMGLELVARAKLESKPFTATVPFFLKAIASCPKVHSDPYYFIGFEYYEKLKNDSAIKYLEKYIAFKDDNEKKFSKDWEYQVQQAKMMVKSAKKENALRKDVQFDPRVITGVSTERDEYLAYITPDDKSCYFVRRVPMENRNQVYASDKEKEVFMIARRDNTGKFDKGEPLGSPFNKTEDSQGGCSISIDNKHLYFALMREEGGLQPNCDIYVSDNSEDEWSDIRKLSANVNDPKFWDSQPTIAADGVTLYFASDRPGGYGGIDLYVTRKNPVTGEWNKPQNLGPKINTAGDEKTPFIHSDSETLYYSSNGHFGFGGYDIFYVRKNAKGEWMDPENIGSPINGETDDTGFFVSKDTKTGYFFSYNEGKVVNRGIGRYDLFGFELYKEARPQQIVFMEGTIKDETGNPVNGAIVEIRDTKTKQVSLATVDSTNGTYMMAVKKQNDLVVTAKKDGIAFNSKLIKAETIKPEVETTGKLDLEVREAKPGSSFVIDDILYTTSSAEIKPESFAILESFAQYLKENKDINVEIQGHTDNVGNPKDNDALSSNRAFSVKSMLEQLGVDGKRITAKGYGASKPRADNNSEEGRAKNRRTEFQIL